LPASARQRALCYNRAYILPKTREVRQPRRGERALHGRLPRWMWVREREVQTNDRVVPIIKKEFAAEPARA